jgi:hypothetical protein
MADNHGSGGSKGIILLLVGGVIILIVAGVVYFMQRSAPAERIKAPVIEEPIEMPAPLVISDNLQPIEQKSQDAGATVATEGPQSPTSNRPKGYASEKMGKIDARQVKVFINSRFSQVRACYERRLKLNPMLEGTLDLRIALSSAGKVTGIGVNKDTVGDSNMTSCVKSTIKKWKFPAPQGGRAVFDKPFKFKKKI